MPKVHQAYFELNLELVSPRNQVHVNFPCHTNHMLKFLYEHHLVYV